MNKLIILTPSIIRGDFHKDSIGKFYNYFYEYMCNKYEIYHIINIDEPEKLKKYFNKYETINVYNLIIPEKINKVFISEPNPGFLQAWKKIISKVEELNLINENYLYYWLEDDWEPKNKYDITIFFNFLHFSNTAYTFTDKAPLGSFRGGPFMTGSYFINIFNIKQYMNNTCDPERQMQRWLRGGYQKNGNSFIHRLNIINNKVNNNIIHIIIICKEENINLNDLNIHHYDKGFDKLIEFKYHLITYDINFNLKYSLIVNSIYTLLSVSNTELHFLFENNYIKYFIIKPSIQFDIGRNFNENFKLEKWSKIEDGTGYANKLYYNAFLENCKNLTDEYLRLEIECITNNSFFFELSFIHQCLPYLEKNYFDNGIKLNIQYYSHIYGNYPNFQVIGDLIQLNYIPSENTESKQFEELNCLKNLTSNNYETQYKNNFVLANEYFYKYFKFSKIIEDESNNIVNLFLHKKVLGLDFVESDIDINEFITILDLHLKKNSYDIFFLISQNNNFIEQINKLYSVKYEILHYNNLKNNNQTQYNRLNIIKNIINEIKNSINDTDKIVFIETKLKEESQLNKLFLQYEIVNSFILSKCNYVLKTNSQLSAYSKIFNPKLKIYKVCKRCESNWPNSCIDFYEY